MRRHAYLQDLADLPLFAGHRPSILELVGKVATPLDLPAGTVLLRQGSWAALFVMLASGRAVLQRDGRRVGALHAGDHIGELPLLRDQPHDATVVTDTPVTAYVVDRRGFSTLLHGVPGLTVRLLLDALDRLDPDAWALTTDRD